MIHQEYQATNDAVDKVSGGAHIPHRKDKGTRHYVGGERDSSNQRNAPMS
jgi:hypothetical protein